jgi:hypothetical protein
MYPTYAISQQGTYLERVRDTAQRGAPAAQFNLGMMYYRGTSNPQDLEEAAKWFRKAAKQNYGNAQLQLGLMYLQGEGVPQDYDEAAKWFRKASEQNHFDAQFQLGLMYLQGKGFPQNPEEAKKWFEKAAKRNVPAAQFNLGLMYLQGEKIPKDYDQAAKWLRKAAEQGDTSAQCMLGAVYIEGFGVTQDYTEAYKWLTLSIAGSKDPQILGKAKNWRDLIAGKLEPRQLREAEQMAEQWKPSLKYIPFGVRIVSTEVVQMSQPYSTVALSLPGSDYRLATVDHEKSNILIDASRDGGAWWSGAVGSFDPNRDHQGKALADHLKSLGFAVTELPQGPRITPDLLSPFNIVIRTSASSQYTDAEIEAYQDYVRAGGKLLLLVDYVRPQAQDPLALSFGIWFQGISQGGNTIDNFEPHPITRGVAGVKYGVGSGITKLPEAGHILGYLSGDTYLDLNDNRLRDPDEPAGVPVLGEMAFGEGKIVFCGDTNMWQWVPQPLVDNTINWFLGTSVAAADEVALSREAKPEQGRNENQLKSDRTSKFEAEAEAKAEIRQAWPADEKGGAAAISPEAYAAQALESVRESLGARGESTEESRLELAREPVVRPDCSGLHGKESNGSQRSAVALRLPDAFVLVDIYRGAEHEEQAVVVFMDRKPAVLFTGQKSGQGVFSDDVMDGAEYKQVAKGLDPFFTIALDVSQSSERFDAFLPQDIRSFYKHPDRKFRMHMPPGAVDPSWREMLSRETFYPGKGSLDGVDGWKKRLSDEELRRFVALSLDLIFQQVWLAFEGLEGDIGTRLKPVLLISNPPEYIQQLEKSVSRNRRLLEAAGVPTPEHLKLTSDYMKQLLGPGTVVKEVAEPEPCPCFLLPYSGEGFIYSKASESEARNNIPADAKLYLFKMANLNLHFSIVNAKARIICIALN